MKDLNVIGPELAPKAKPQVNPNNGPVYGQYLATVSQIIVVVYEGRDKNYIEAEAAKGLGIIGSLSGTTGLIEVDLKELAKRIEEYNKTHIDTEIITQFQQLPEQDLISAANMKYDDNKNKNINKDLNASSYNKVPDNMKISDKEQKKDLPNLSNTDYNQFPGNLNVTEDETKNTL